jgi:hypothetical protein
VTQLQIAIRNPHAALIGAVLGGLVPWFGRTLAHSEIQRTWATNLPLVIAMIMVVIGCGSFSGLSVFKFGKAVFKDPRKALGFVLALEGVMLVSHGMTSAIALAVLILINAVANGSVIALARDATCKKQAADARGAATRARRHAKAPTTHASTLPSTCCETPSYMPRHASLALLWQRPPFNTVIDVEGISERFPARAQGAM